MFLKTLEFLEEILQNLRENLKLPNSFGFGLNLYFFFFFKRWIKIISLQLIFFGGRDNNSLARSLSHIYNLIFHLVVSSRFLLLEISKMKQCQNDEYSRC